jgi:nicotinate phosphoribosyltransferase
MSEQFQPPVSLWPDPAALGTVTDLYQLTMMAGYYAARKDLQRAMFELFVRHLPPHRSYLVFAGLEQAVGDLLRLAFSAEQVDDIRRWPVFASVDPGFFDWLLTLRFEGDVWAVPEGTVVFAGEPLVRIEADLAQAQWVETILLASIGYPTLVASKAARVVQAAAGRPVFDFGARRGHGPHAGLLAARAAYLAGCAGTSHVEAARRLNIPASGTMAHSWVESFTSEAKAFRAFAQTYPDQTTLLVDTYDTLAGVEHAAAIEPPVQAIRLDSGDLLGLARRARAILDEHGRSSVRIFASGDLNEDEIQRLVAEGTPIDAFGVGTDLITSRDAPSLAVVYKLVELEGSGRMKLSAGKPSYPMAKQIYRKRDGLGRFLGDVVALGDESPPDGEPLLQPVVQGGRLVRPLPGLGAIRAHCREQIAALPETLRSLDAIADYPVTISAALQAATKHLTDRIAAQSRRVE